MRNLGVFRGGLGLSIGVLLVAVAGTVRAQEAPPASPPEQPAAPDAAPAAPPAPAPAPPAPPAPPPAPPPAYPPPQAYPPAGPPPGYAPYPGPAAGFEEGGAPVERKERFRGGPYFGAAVGYGAPLGAQTVSGSEDASIGGGVGVIGSIGYQIIQNFGLGAFIHWNNVAIEYSDNSEPDDSSASVLFYGLEARAGFITDVVDGWASIGIALGTGSLTTSDEETQCTGGVSGCFSFSSEVEDDVTFGPMPTFAFGAAAKLSSQWGIGPVFRMYLLSVGEACVKAKAEQSTPGFPPETFEDDDCTKDTDEVAVPNVAFAGLELVFRP